MDRIIRAIIVEDDPQSTQLLKSMLNAFPKIMVCEEVDDGEKAIQLINRINPDLLFLDIHLPNQNGF